jgi:hypothetical protein
VSLSISRAVAACALSACSAGALAEGPGKYTVSETNVRDRSEYRGSATLTRTGPLTWEIVEEIGGDTLEGFVVGASR